MKLLFDLDDFNDIEEMLLREENPVSKLYIANKLLSDLLKVQFHL